MNSLALSIAIRGTQQEAAALLLEDAFRGHSQAADWKSRNDREMKKDNPSAKTIPALPGPHCQPNDYIHAMLKSIYYKKLREKMGLNADLRLRPAKEDIPTFEGSGLRKGL